MIVCIEGQDAAGKATHAKLLAERLGGVVLSFPHYDSPTGQAILGKLKEEWCAQFRTTVQAHEITPLNVRANALVLQVLNAQVLQALMTVNRLEQVPYIERLRSQGTPIILDRYYASALVYGSLDGLDKKWLELIHASLPQPDKWVLLDVSAEESVRRRPERRDEYERRPGFMEKVRAGYLRLFEERRAKCTRCQGATYQERGHCKPCGGTGRGPWYIVDGHGTVEQVQERIGKMLGL